MNLIDREIEKFEKWWNAQGNRRRDIKLEKQFLTDSLQRVIDETKEKCIEALPKEKELINDCDCESCQENWGFNQAIQQAKQNIKGIKE